MSLADIIDATQEASIRAADTEELEDELERRRQKKAELFLERTADEYKQYIAEYFALVQKDPENLIEERAYDERVDALESISDDLPFVEWVHPDEVEGTNARDSDV